MKRSLFSFIALVLLSLQAAAQLPTDPSVRMGKLDNGLTYYLRHNAKEAGLADFYIAQRVGSILEEPRQRGLAHFLEHMAFNGTKQFPGKDGQLGIVPWCETIGVKFGANLNAYTSVDQTVYHIGSAPLKREGILDSCLLVLNDWSHYILLEDKEIDKERGVIHEEWRTRRAGMAMQRLMEDAMPVIYKGSKYEDCLPIGSMDIVDNFPYQDLRDYYQKWYRPDLQAIIVVGDIDVDQVEQKVKTLFSQIPKPQNAAERIYYSVPDNDKMIVAVLKDKEQPIVMTNLYMKRDATPDSQKNSERYLRGDYVDGLIAYMLNGRLGDIRQQANPPFLSATGHASTFFVSRTKEAFSLSVSCKLDNILGSITAAVAAVERARQHGFTQAELDRAKMVNLTAAERRYKERNERRNGYFVNKCVSHFLTAEPLVSEEFELQLTQRLDREVTLDEVNRAARELISDQNQVCVLYGPDKEGVTLPTEQQLEQTILTAQQQRYEAYQEQQLADRLVSKLPKPGTIVSEKPFKHGFTELTLSNGMKVYVRSTDFTADQLQMTIKADGGTSRYGDDDIPNFSLISSSITEAGVGDFDASTLRKMLAGKAVRVAPSVGSRGQSISGSGSVKEAKTMFELAYLYFTQPRRDTTAFNSLMNRTRSFLSNRNASPKVDYNDSIRAILYDHHPRMAPVTQEVIDKADYDRIFQIYKECFSDASNFKTVIIGHMTLDELRPLLCQYLATLPSTGQHASTNWDNVPRIVGGESAHIFRKPMATPLANVSIYYTADVPFTPQSDLELDFLKRCLSIAYTDSVREEKGGTYGVGVDFELDKDDCPNATLKISYNADPDRYRELNPIIYQQLKNIAEQGPAAASMDKVKQYLVKQYAQLAIDDGYWDYVIWHELDDDADFDINYCQMVEQMTPQQVQQMARRMLEARRRIEVTMLSGTPETAHLHVGDMHCQKCADRITRRLLAVKGIDSMEADIRRQNITVSFDGSQLTADSIRTLVTKAGYTPVRACKCGKGAYAYFLIPADQATQATVGTALAIKGVEDANASSLRKALAVKYHHQEITEEQLLSALRKAGISATLPKPHECKEEK
jgi:zinc protease